MHTDGHAIHGTMVDYKAGPVATKGQGQQGHDVLLSKAPVEVLWGWRCWPRRRKIPTLPWTRICPRGSAPRPILGELSVRDRFRRSANRPVLNPPEPPWTPERLHAAKLWAWSICVFANPKPPIPQKLPALPD